MERSYSVADIDAMRNALSWSYPPNVSFYSTERSAEIEQRIRTYMVGGCDPKEVIARCAEIMKQQQGFQLQQDRQLAGGKR